MRNAVIFFLALALAPGLNCAAQELSVSTNAADYADMGTLNLEMSYAFSRRWTAVLGARYNPFQFGDSFRKQRTVDAGVRYWMWHFYSGWWFSAKARYQEYAESTKGKSPVEGERLGASVGVGYSLMLSQHLNLDFGLGVWGGRDVYTAYSCPRCGRIVATGSEIFLLPSDIMLSLAFIF